MKMQDVMIKLSKTSKLGGILSWSLPAVDTCPGSKRNGAFVPACSGCYARSGNYRFPAVKNARAHNMHDWKRDAWVNDMINALDNSRWFRWFDSGDIYTLALANKIYEVCKATPHVQHWIPTRSGKLSKFAKVLRKLSLLPNVVVRHSSDNINGKLSDVSQRVNNSVIIPTADHQTSATVCEAYAHDGTCNGCRACWNKSIKTIAYPAHGKTMMKVIRIAAA